MTAAPEAGSQLADSGPQTQLVLGDSDGDGKTDRAVVTRDCRYRAYRVPIVCPRDEPDGIHGSQAFSDQIAALAYETLRHYF